MRNLIDQRVGKKVAKAYRALDILTAFVTKESTTSIRAMIVLAIEFALFTWLYSRKTLIHTPVKQVKLETAQTHVPGSTLREQVSHQEQQQVDDIITNLAEKDIAHTHIEVAYLVSLGYKSLDIYNVLYTLAKSKYPASCRSAILASLDNKTLGTAKPFKSRSSLERHAFDHGGVFGDTTPEEYQKQAMTFMSGPLPWHVMQLKRPNGEYVRWNSSTGQFGVCFKDSRIKTYFLGKDWEEGYKYFLEQHFRDDEEAQKKAGEQTGMWLQVPYNELEKYRAYWAKIQQRVS